MDRTRVARQYEPELAALRETGYAAELSWGEGDTAAMRIDRPGGYIVVTDGVLDGRLADRETEAAEGWRVLACGDFNDFGAVVAEDDTLITEDSDAPALLTAIDRLTRRFFPAVDVGRL